MLHLLALNVVMTASPVSEAGSCHRPLLWHVSQGMAAAWILPADKVLLVLHTATAASPAPAGGPC